MPTRKSDWTGSAIVSSAFGANSSLRASKTRPLFKFNRSSRKGRINRFRLENICKADDNSQVSPDLRSKTDFSCKNEHNFEVLSETQVAGIRQLRGGGHVTVEDLRTGSTREWGTNGKKTTVLVAGAGKLVAGNSDGTATQYSVGGDSPRGTVQTEYAHLGVGAICSGAQVGHLILLGGWDSSFRVVDVVKQSPCAGPVKTSVEYIYSLQVCRIEKKGDRLLAEPDILVSVSGEGKSEVEGAQNRRLASVFRISKLVYFSGNAGSQKIQSDCMAELKESNQSEFLRKYCAKLEQQFESTNKKKDKLIEKLKNKCEILSKKNILLEHIKIKHERRKVEYSGKLGEERNQSTPKIRKLRRQIEEFKVGKQGRTN